MEDHLKRQLQNTYSDISQQLLIGACSNLVVGGVASLSSAKSVHKTSQYLGLFLFNIPQTMIYCNKTQIKIENN